MGRRFSPKVLIRDLANRFSIAIVEKVIVVLVAAGFLKNGYAGMVAVDEHPYRITI
jgi:hypothetical protein